MQAGDVVLTILTGKRPDLLRRTLASLDHVLLKTAHVFVFHNGGGWNIDGTDNDPETTAVLDSFSKRIDVRALGSFERILSIGEAMGRIARYVSGVAEVRPFWLHLEDDWKTVLRGESWLVKARRILLEHPEIVQVRLRARRERVLPRHVVTGENLLWFPADELDCSGGWLRCEDAHLTFNPTLMRSSIAQTMIFNSLSGEREFQKRAHIAGFRGVAQLDPGVFVHIGGESGGPESLRSQTKCTP